jgi:hypothetical protein
MMKSDVHMKGSTMHKTRFGVVARTTFLLHSTMASAALPVAGAFIGFLLTAAFGAGCSSAPQSDASSTSVSAVIAEGSHSAAVEGSPPAEYVQIPGGYTHQSCVHSIPKGGIVNANSDVLDADGHFVEHVPECAYPPIHHPRGHGAPARDPNRGVEPSLSGWVSGTQQFLPAGATTWNGYTSTMTVPPNPSRVAGQTLFYFGGLTPANGDQIIQPVLQWGPSDPGGGDFWSIASWNVHFGGNAFVSPHVTVHPGDRIDTSITMLVGGIWYVYAYDTTLGNFTEAKFWVHETMTEMFPAVFEAKKEPGFCENGVEFTNIRLAANVGHVAQPWTQVWQPYNPVDCDAVFSYCHVADHCFHGATTTGTTTDVF